MSAATEATLFRICDQSTTLAAMLGDDAFRHLSRRQMEIAYLVAVGYEYTEIAAALEVHVQTVRHHCSRIYRRLGLTGGNQRVQLARMVWTARGA